jgi:sirohydrochlorin cobaltochelatase
MHHIIFAAFGVRKMAEPAYRRIDETVAERFPHAQRHWYYSSPASSRRTDHHGSANERSLKDIVSNTTTPGDRIVVQSLHLTPGIEFHQLMDEVFRCTADIAIGMPLLCHPEDHRRVVCSILPILPPTGSQAVLLIGHGTTHPSWTTLPVFAATLQKHVGPHVFLAVLNHYPDSSGVIDEIVAAGYQEVLVVPLLMATGTHFARDIAGESSSSWASRIRQRGLELSICHHGIAVLPGIAEIFADHIEHAQTRRQSIKPFGQVE